MTLVLSNGMLEVAVLAEKGADIYSVHVPSGVDLMFKSPWGSRPMGSYATTSQERWLEAYAGGWQLLIPNGGDECSQYGARWGFHGEAALATWDVIEVADTDVTLATMLISVPLLLERRISLKGTALSVRDVVTNTSRVDIEIMWSHHPAFGAPFLGRGCSLSAGCTEVVGDDRDPGTLLSPGARSAWPFAKTASGGTIDLRVLPGPDEPRSVLAYLTGFASGWFRIMNKPLGLGVVLRWPAEMFPCAWLWQEVHSTKTWPWFGRAYVVAVEPASTWPGQGMSGARTKGGRGVLLPGGSSAEAVVEAMVFEGDPPEDFCG